MYLQHARYFPHQCPPALLLRLRFRDFRFPEPETQVDQTRPDHSCPRLSCLGPNLLGRKFRTLPHVPHVKRTKKARYEPRTELPKFAKKHRSGPPVLLSSPPAKLTIVHMGWNFDGGRFGRHPRDFATNHFQGGSLLKFSLWLLFLELASAGFEENGRPCFANPGEPKNLRFHPSSAVSPAVLG